MFAEDELLPISALQHLAFCPRQWGLIHLEQQWAENRLTAEGRLLHERADEPAEELRDGVRICRGLRLRSLALGLSGVADVVEFRPEPFPVEYKRGRKKPDQCDEVQLCAQGLCLEEMLGVHVPEGAMFYGQPRRRMPVVFDDRLRWDTKELSVRLHELSRGRQTPAAQYARKCERCSLLEICRPRATGGTRSAARYLREALASSLASEGSE